MRRRALTIRDPNENRRRRRRRRRRVPANSASPSSSENTRRVRREDCPREDRTEISPPPPRRRNHRRRFEAVPRDLAGTIDTSSAIIFPLGFIIDRQPEQLSLKYDTIGTAMFPSFSVICDHSLRISFDRAPTSRFHGLSLSLSLSSALTLHRERRPPPSESTSPVVRETCHGRSHGRGGKGRGDGGCRHVRQPRKNK